MEVRWLGRVEHAAAVAAQEELRDRLLSSTDAVESILLAEHDPVITLGRSADASHILADVEELRRRGVAVVHASRGGDVTYHGPGQLMVYPVVRVRRVVAFLEAVAGALAETAATLGVPGAEWRRDPAGLWLGEKKLAACGIHLRRGVSIHGFALNVATPPDVWRWIVPCGLPSPITSLAEELAGRPSVPSVAQVAEVAAPRLERWLAAGSTGGCAAQEVP